MNNKIKNKINKLLLISKKMNECSIINCKKLYDLNQKNKNLIKYRNILKNEEDINKREKIIKKIINSKNKIKFQKCVFNKCLLIMKKYVVLLLTIFKDFNKILKIPSFINDNVKKAEIIINKKTLLNENELKELSKYILTFINYIKHNINKK